MSLNKKQSSDKLSTPAAERARIRRRWHRGTVGHVFTVIGTILLGLIVLVVMVLNQFFNGPSPAASDFGVQTLHQSSALKFVPYLFLFEHVQEALDRGEVVSGGEETNATLVNVAGRTKKDYGTGAENTDTDARGTGDETPVGMPDADKFDENGIYIEDVYGATFHGYMMVVRDPAQVSLATCSNRFTKERAGKRVDEMMREYGAVAVMNGGAFNDPNGGGNGGLAEGLVFSQGRYMNHASGTYKVVAGFDQNDILHVGSFTKEQAEKLGLRDACAFGPALIVNGVPSVAKDKGLNPRSAIGQRADGAVLLLVIDGRQANSMGATIEDVINVMLSYGAVNACNMDGGSSTTMYYGDDKINDGMTVSVSRKMATAWIVKGAGAR